MVNLRLLIACFLAISVMDCSTRIGKTEQTEDQTQHKNAGQAFANGKQIAPGHCRIIGTLVAVDSTLENEGPCSKAPCRGVVRVDSVIGYGSSFANPVAVAQRIDVRFAFTIAATTEELFPNMTDRLPGLHIGERFQTDLESRNEISLDGRRQPYLVHFYEVLSQH